MMSLLPKVSYENSAISVKLLIEWFLQFRHGDVKVQMEKQTSKSIQGFFIFIRFIEQIIKIE